MSVSLPVAPCYPVTSRLGLARLPSGALPALLIHFPQRAQSSRRSAWGGAIMLFHPVPAPFSLPVLLELAPCWLYIRVAMLPS